MLLISFLPILLFVVIYVGTSIYFSFLGVSNAFYQLSPVIAIIPSIVLGWILVPGRTEQKMKSFIDGVRHPDIITMCIIFLLAGAFSSVTQVIGSIDSTVNMALSFISPEFLLIGIFLTAAFISISIGTSMGTIATIAPLAASFAQQGIFSPAIGMATVVGGAMFGDNLSLISDTTIAAVASQEADIKAKLQLNFIVAIIAAILSIVILFFIRDSKVILTFQDYSLLLVLPYIVLIVLALLGVNVFIVLLLSIFFAGLMGYFHHGYSLFCLAQDSARGFSSMHEIMVLSLLVGGLSGLTSKGFRDLTERLIVFISGFRGTQKVAQYVIAGLVSVFDILLANNTVAIVFSGDVARTIAKRYNIPPHYSAAWLDIFSCVFQGIIPYGAQILLASSIAGISPVSIVLHVYYCYVLAIVAILYIALNTTLMDV